MGSAPHSPEKYRPMDTIKQELRIALTERAMKLKSATRIYAIHENDHEIFGLFFGSGAVFSESRKSVRANLR